MLKTDYSNVSKVYDKNKSRTTFPIDKDLEELLFHKEEFTVLDLACGTGNWLYCQQSQFNSKKIKWIGMDASEDMLKLAKEKNLDAQFIHSTAENLNLNTKCDLIDEELISMIQDELPSDIPAVFISAPTGYGLTELKDLLWREMNSESNKLQSISDASSIVHRDMDVRNIQADFSEWDAGIEVVEEGVADEEDWDEDEVIEV